MGDFKLYQQRDSAQRIDNFYHVLYRSFANSVDDFISEGLKMYEAKIGFLLLTLLGIPAYIYAWFLDIGGTAEVWKGIVLATIGGLTGLVILCRQYIKLRREWKDYKNDYPGKKIKQP